MSKPQDDFQLPPSIRLRVSWGGLYSWIKWLFISMASGLCGPWLCDAGQCSETMWQWSALGLLMQREIICSPADVLTVMRFIFSDYSFFSQCKSILLLSTCVCEYKYNHSSIDWLKPKGRGVLSYLRNRFWRRISWRRSVRLWRALGCYLAWIVRDGCRSREKSFVIVIGKGELTLRIHLTRDLVGSDWKYKLL